MALDAIRRFFDRRAAPITGPDPGASDPDETNARVRLAACALLLELAHADDEFMSDERQHIEESLARHFAVSPEDATELIELAERERREAVDLYQFTSLITAAYDMGQRMLLAEIMWRVVFADGDLSKHESHLLRRVSKLLDLEPGYLAEARKRAGDPERST